MAYVAISTGLKNDVVSRINSMHQTERQQMQEPATALQVQHDDPMVLEFIWGNHIHLKDAIPIEWCSMTETIRLKSVTSTITNRNMTVEFALKAAGREKFRVPQSGMSNYSGLVIDNLPITHPLLADLWVHSVAVNELQDRWKKIRHDVLAFLNSAKSLNEAIKLWPAVALYIPEQYLKKVAEKKEKVSATPSAAAAMLANIDTGGITAAAVSARMSTA